MIQDLFKIPWTNIMIHSYGLAMVIGFLLAMELAKFLARRSRIDPEIFVNCALIALITGVIGARFSHVLENWSQYANPSRSFNTNFLDAINVTSGGLTYYGGFLFATPCCIFYGILKKVHIPTGMDIVAPCLMIGLSIGRVGCYLNGCCYGAECDLPWAVRFPYMSSTYIDQYVHHKLTPADELLVDTVDGKRLMPPAEAKAKGFQKLIELERAKVHPVHPAQLYSTITALILSALLTMYYTTPHVPGRVFAWMCILEGSSRFVLEMLRVEPAVGFGLSFSMWIGVGLVIAGIVLWFFYAQLTAKTPDKKLAMAHGG